MKTPETVILAVFAAINTEDWHGLSELCDPLSLILFKRFMLRLLSYSAEDDDIDDEFTDDFGDDHADFRDRLRFEVSGVESVREIEEMDPGRVFVRWIQARASLLNGDKVEPWRNGGEESARRTVRSYKYSVLGSVPDGDEFVHVLYRPTIDQSEWHPDLYDNAWNERSEEERRFVETMHQRGDPSVAVCRKQSDGSWKMVAKRNFWLFDSVDEIEVRNRGSE